MPETLLQGSEPVDSIPRLVNSPHCTCVSALCTQELSPVETYLSAQPQSATIVEISLRHFDNHRFCDLIHQVEPVHPLWIGESIQLRQATHPNTPSDSILFSRRGNGPWLSYTFNDSLSIFKCLSQSQCIVVSGQSLIIQTVSHPSHLAPKSMSFCFELLSLFFRYFFGNKNRRR